MIITLCFDYYDEKSGMIAKRILLFQGNREVHAINHNTNRDMANITICSTSRKFDILQGTGQGRIPAPFMYKVYINGLLNELTQHSCALSLYSISLTSPSFADDISLLSIYPTFLSSLMNLFYAYSIKWRYEFNHVKSGIVTFGESKRVHSEAMKERTGF